MTYRLRTRSLSQADKIVDKGHARMLRRDAVPLTGTQLAELDAELRSHLQSADELRINMLLHFSMCREMAYEDYRTKRITRRKFERFLSLREVPQNIASNMRVLTQEDAISPATEENLRRIATELWNYLRSQEATYGPAFCARLWELFAETMSKPDTGKLKGRIASVTDLAMFREYMETRETQRDALRSAQRAYKEASEREQAALGGQGPELPNRKPKEEPPPSRRPGYEQPSREDKVIAKTYLYKQMRKAVHDTAYNAGLTDEDFLAYVLAEAVSRAAVDAAYRKKLTEEGRRTAEIRRQIKEAGREAAKRARQAVAQRRNPMVLPPLITNRKKLG